MIGHSDDEQRCNEQRIAKRRTGQPDQAKQNISSPHLAR
jgi:hypothetical protein